MEKRTTLEEETKPPLIKIHHHEPRAESFECHQQEVRRLLLKLEEVKSEADKLDETDFFVIDKIKRSLDSIVASVDCCVEDFKKCGLLITDKTERLNLRDNEVAQLYRTLKEECAVIRKHLTEKKRQLFAPIREQIRTGEINPQELRARIEQLLQNDTGPYPTTSWQVADSYVNGILDINETPPRASELEAGMIFYHPTNIEEILELIDRVGITSNDTIYDIGSGLGRVPLVTNLLTGAKSIGVEYDPAYSKFAEEKRIGLNLTSVEFITADAREADYPKATVFYMYAPFSEDILKEVVKKIYEQARQRKIKIALCAIGNFLSLTTKAVGKPWLKVTHNTDNLKVYESTL